MGQVGNKIDTNLVAWNIKNWTSIFWITWTYTGSWWWDPNNTQEITAKALWPISQWDLVWYTRLSPQTEVPYSTATAWWLYNTVYTYNWDNYLVTTSSSNNVWLQIFKKVWTQYIIHQILEALNPSALYWKVKTVLVWTQFYLWIFEWNYRGIKLFKLWADWYWIVSDAQHPLYLSNLIPSTIDVNWDMATDGTNLFIIDNFNAWWTWNFYKYNGTTWTDYTSTLSSLYTTAVKWLSLKGIWWYIWYWYTITTSKIIRLNRFNGTTFDENSISDNTFWTAWAHSTIYEYNSEIFYWVTWTSSPFIKFYKWVYWSFTELTQPTTLPTGVQYIINFISDWSNLYVVWTGASNPTIRFYKYNGTSQFVKEANPTQMPLATYLIWTNGTTTPFIEWWAIKVLITWTSNPFIALYSLSWWVWSLDNNFPLCHVGYYGDYTMFWWNEYTIDPVSVSPYVNIWKRTGTSGKWTLTSSWITGIANWPWPVKLCVHWSELFANYCCWTSPAYYFKSSDWTFSWVPLTNNMTAHTGNISRSDMISFGWTLYTATCSSSSPYLVTGKWDWTSAFVNVTNDWTPNSSTYKCWFATLWTDLYLIVWGSSGWEYISIYKMIAWTWTKQTVSSYLATSFIWSTTFATYTYNNKIRIVFWLAWNINPRLYVITYDGTTIRNDSSFNCSFFGTWWVWAYWTFFEYNSWFYLAVWWSTTTVSLWVYKYINWIWTLLDVNPFFTYMNTTVTHNVYKLVNGSDLFLYVKSHSAFRHIEYKFWEYLALPRTQKWMNTRMFQNVWIAKANITTWNTWNIVIPLDTNN